MSEYSEFAVLEGFNAMCYDPRRYEKMREILEPFKATVTQEQRQIEVVITAKDPLDALDLIHAVCNCVKDRMKAVPKWDVPEREGEVKS